MNLILFEPGEILIPRDDLRIQHILTILKMKPGEEFDAGIIDGPRGKAWIDSEEDSQEVSIGFRSTEEPHPLAPLALAVGACRPQTVRKILLQATTLGVGAIHFFASSKSEQGYLKSKMYRAEQIRPYLIEGAQQAFCTLLPKVVIHDNFQDCLEANGKNPGISLDNYEAVSSLGNFDFTSIRTLTLWIGSERGWSAAERNSFRDNEITLCSLGTRVLRTETAAVAGTALCLSGLGWFE